VSVNSLFATFFVSLLLLRFSLIQVAQTLAV
jgi:hypothetical protein